MNLLNRIAHTLLDSMIYYIERYRLLRAIRKAKRLHSLNGKKYWVIKLLGQYRVYSTVDIKELKAKGIFSKDLDFIRLQSVAAYNTNEKDR